MPGPAGRPHHGGDPKVARKKTNLGESTWAARAGLFLWRNRPGGPILKKDGRRKPVYVIQHHIIGCKTLNNNFLWVRIFGSLGAVSGLLGVALGAFGAHGLKGRLTPEDLAIFETGVRYQMYHALALLLLAGFLARGGGGASPLAGWAFTVGIAVFSGSLYLMVLTGERWLGAVTPLGGLAFLVGWAALAWSFLRP